MKSWQIKFNRGVKGDWYRRKAGGNQGPCTYKVGGLITEEVMRKAKRSTLSRVTQMRTGHGRFGEYFRRFNVQNVEYYCDCSEGNILETVEHIIRDCPKNEDARKNLAEKFPAMELKDILGTKKGLRELT